MKLKQIFPSLKTKHMKKISAVTCVTNPGHKHYLRQITLTIFKDTLMQIVKSANTAALI